MADVQLPVSRGPRSMTAMFGEDSNDSQQPLWFKKDVFLQSDFESESYIADLRRFIALDTLRAELRGHLAVLKNELVELINRDYADFVNLTTKLVDVEGAVLRMRTPLTELRAKISSVKDSVDSSLLALQNGLQRRAEASSSREILELLLDTSHVVLKVEKLMVELQSMPEEGPISQIEPASKSSFSNGTMAEISENGANLEETRSMLLERIASEMNRLKFYIARAQYIVVPLFWLAYMADTSDSFIVPC